MSTSKININSDDLKFYYTHIFPAESITKWLILNSKLPLCNREIGFEYTMEDNTSKVQRHKSFDDYKQLKTYLIENCPNKLDIGACFNQSPQKVKTQEYELKKKTNIQQQQQLIQPFYFEEKELAFDVDISDYDDFQSRNCCNVSDDNKSICEKCWPIIICAMKILKYYLQESFGLKEYIWIFSGGKGLHCWVSDKITKPYTEYMRNKLISRIGYKYINITHNDPDYINIYNNILLPCFEQMVVIHDYFGTQLKCTTFIKQYFTDQNVQEKITIFLNENWDERKQTSMDCWNLLNQFVSKTTVQGLQFILRKVVFDKVYIKLDTGVSNQMNHLLKCPFAVHPKTGNICVPINENTILNELLEINIKNIIMKENIMKPYIEIFNSYIHSIVNK